MCVENRLDDLLDILGCIWLLVLEQEGLFKSVSFSHHQLPAQLDIACGGCPAQSQSHPVVAVLTEVLQSPADSGWMVGMNRVEESGQPLWRMAFQNGYWQLALGQPLPGFRRDIRFDAWGHDQSKHLWISGQIFQNIYLRKGLIGGFLGHDLQSELFSRHTSDGIVH